MVSRCTQMQFNFELRSLNGQKITYMCLEGQMTPRIFQNFTLQFQQCTLNIGKKFEGRKRKLSPVRHQTCIVPSQNHEPSSELLRFVRGVCPNFVKHAKFFSTSSWWHGITSTKVSCVSDFFKFLELKCHVTPCLIVSQPLDQYV